MVFQRISHLTPFKLAKLILVPFAMALVITLGAALALSVFMERSLNRLELASIFGLVGVACFAVAGVFAKKKVQHRRSQSLKDSALW